MRQQEKRSSCSITGPVLTLSRENAAMKKQVLLARVSGSPFYLGHLLSDSAIKTCSAAIFVEASCPILPILTAADWLEPKRSPHWGRGVAMGNHAGTGAGGVRLPRRL